MSETTYVRPGFTTLEKLKGIRRELAMRNKVYPKWVAAGKMKQTTADYELAVLQAIHDDYQLKLDQEVRHGTG
jgi:hypothetical protein